MHPASGKPVFINTALSAHAVNKRDPDGLTQVLDTDAKGLIFATVVS